MKIDKILFPTDFSPCADHALKQAVALARAHRAKLTLFHAVLLHAEEPGHLSARWREYMDELWQDADRQLQERAASVSERGVDFRIATARSVSAFEAIMDQADELEPALMVMGTHGRSGLRKLLMGSVAEKVLRHARCPVMTLGREAPLLESMDGFQRILVAIDFTEHSRRALDAARSLLSERGRLALVHTVATPLHPSFYAGGVTRLFQVDPDLPDRVRAHLLSWLGEEPGETVVTEGQPPEEILRMAEEKKSQLLVLGSRGLSGLDHLLLGSVTEKVVRTAKVPVLTVK
jgi:nucleotide-binding universal stress UspA family protein